MAQKNSSEKVNKSQAIRDYKATHRRAKPKAISEALTEEGIDVSPAVVSAVLYNAKTKKKTSKRSNVPKKSTAGRASRQSVDLDALKKAKKLSDEMGGIDKAKEALDALAQLTD